MTFEGELEFIAWYSIVVYNLGAMCMASSNHSDPLKWPMTVSFFLTRKTSSALTITSGMGDRLFRNLFEFIAGLLTWCTSPCARE